MKMSKKALANNIATKAEDTKVKEAYIKDMAKSEDQLTLKAQKDKYFDWLATEVLKPSPFKFFVDMFRKLQTDESLTTNMTTALDKCLTRNSAKAEEKPEADCKSVTLKMRQWWTKEKKLDSRVITGKILRETEKAYYIKGHADMVEGTFCMRCGRELTEPASMLVGFGSDCCSHLGIAYPTDILTASKKERTAVRKQLLKVLHNQVFETWVPKSQIEQEF
jgi:hypothetical protein